MRKRSLVTKLLIINDIFSLLIVLEHTKEDLALVTTLIPEVKLKI